MVPQPTGWSGRGLSRTVDMSVRGSAVAGPRDERTGVALGYQELLVTPGSSPRWAIWRRHTRHSPNTR
jgi:hypothetical protein